MATKRKYREGGVIYTLDELMRQEIVIVNGKTTPKGWFTQWKLFMAMNFLERGMIRLAVPITQITKEKDNV